MLDGGNLILMYYRARTCDPQTGRFMQRDPLGIDPAGGKINPFNVKRQYKDGINIYEYIKSSPTVKLDPYGLMPKSCCEKVLPGLLAHPAVSPTYARARAAKDIDEKPCLKKVSCESCPSGWMGYYSFDKRKIVLCTHKGPGFNISEIRETIIHELNHAVQCDLTRNCGHCMRKEIEAYYFDGSCTTEAGCVASAWMSCSAKPFCAGKNPGQYMGRFPFPPTPPSPPR